MSSNLAEPKWIMDSLMSGAEKAGINEFEVFLVKGRSLAIAAKEGRIDQVRRNDEFGASVRIVDQGRLGFSYTSVFTPEALERTVNLAVESASMSDPEPGLSIPDPPDSDYPVVKGYDPEINNIPQSDKIDAVLAMEAEARSVDPRIERVRSAEYREAEYYSWLSNSRGLEYSNSGTVFSGSIQIKASEGDEAEMGYEGDFSRFYSGLDLKEIGVKGARRAVSCLGGKKVAGGTGAVIMENRVVAQFLGVLENSFLSDSVRKGKSSLAGRVGEAVMGSEINLADDGLYPNGLVSSPADGEGVPSRRTILLENGILKGFLYDTTRATAEGVSSTGNAGRGGYKSPPGVTTRNLILDPGDMSLEEMAGDLGTGLLVTEVMGVHTTDPISGDFSLGVAGQWLKNGRPEHPVKGMAIAGNIFKMFSHVAGIGADLRLFGSIGAPSLLLDGLTLSGL